MAEYNVGLDPGQTQDPTALAVVRTLQDGDKPVFQCGHLERLPLGTPYPGIIQHTRRLLQKEPLLGKAELILDLTGVGRAVGDMFRQEGMHPVRVTITAGLDETVDDRGEHHVAKMILVSTVQALLHDGRLLIQKDLPDAPALRTELEDFRATVTDSGRWTFGARAGQHDDLVLALSLAVWRAYKRRTRPIHPSVLARSAQIWDRPSLDRFDRFDRGGGHDAIGELRSFQQRALRGR
jgi:hypothetical protein